MSNKNKQTTEKIMTAADLASVNSRDDDSLSFISNGQIEPEENQNNHKVKITATTDGKIWLYPPSGGSRINLTQTALDEEQIDDVNEIPGILNTLGEHRNLINERSTVKVNNIQDQRIDALETNIGRIDTLENNIVNIPATSIRTTVASQGLNAAGTGTLVAGTQLGTNLTNISNNIRNLNTRRQWTFTGDANTIANINAGVNNTLTISTQANNRRYTNVGRSAAFLNSNVNRFIELFNINLVGFSNATIFAILYLHVNTALAGNQNGFNFHKYLLSINGTSGDWRNQWSGVRLLESTTRVDVPAIDIVRMNSTTFTVVATNRLGAITAPYTLYVCDLSSIAGIFVPLNSNSTSGVRINYTTPNAERSWLPSQWVGASNTIEMQNNRRRVYKNTSSTTSRNLPTPTLDEIKQMTEYEVISYWFNDYFENELKKVQWQIDYKPNYDNYYKRSYDSFEELKVYANNLKLRLEELELEGHACREFFYEEDKDKIIGNTSVPMEEISDLSDQQQLEIDTKIRMEVAYNQIKCLKIEEYCKNNNLNLFEDIQSKFENTDEMCSYLGIEISEEELEDRFSYNLSIDKGDSKEEVKIKI